MDSAITPLGQIKSIIYTNQDKKDTFRNFVLQGGAGSGKTETLKQVIEHISEHYPDKKIACITLTNTAVDELKSRVGEKHLISTIHSFLNQIIKDYKKNMHQIIDTIFTLKKVEELEHDIYKDKYKKYSDRLYALHKQKIKKYAGKVEYKKDPNYFNTELNTKIELLNAEIVGLIKAKDYSSIRYNETRFEKFEELTFGHDRLLEVSIEMFKKFILLGKIVSDKFDFILIDEYQDTNEKVIEIFLNHLPENYKTTIGLFGDSMQGIYDNGIGDIEKQVQQGKLVKIEKEDNYRCSHQVIEFINQIRNDGIKQKVALKEKSGIRETNDDREGIVKLFYSFYPSKPNAFSPRDEKDQYLLKLNELITKSLKDEMGYKKLMLTNKSISTELNFASLYKIYDNRYSEVKEEIEKDMQRLQFLDLIELIQAYNQRNFNFVLRELKKNGFSLKTAEDKTKIKTVFDNLIINSDSAHLVMEYSLQNNIIKKSDLHEAYLNRRDIFRDEIKNDAQYIKLKKFYLEGHNTAVKMSKVDNSISEEEFNDCERKYKKECFYNALFSEDLKFSELVNYHRYLNEELPYVTMHKTKGSGIENVAVVLEEYFWNKYNFKSIYTSDVAYADRKSKNQKIFYVACSRAIKNLICIRLVEDQEEEANLLELFKNFQTEKIQL
jgi:DNA helicase-2/ATP-dependent DNA helicase PcrA